MRRSSVFECLGLERNSPGSICSIRSIPSFRVSCRCFAGGIRSALVLERQGIIKGETGGFMKIHLAVLSAPAVFASLLVCILLLTAAEASAQLARPMPPFRTQPPLGILPRATTPLPSAVGPLPPATTPLPPAVAPLPPAVSALPPAVAPLPSAVGPLPSATAPLPSAVAPLPPAVSELPQATGPLPSATEPLPPATTPLPPAIDPLP